MKFKSALLSFALLTACGSHKSEKHEDSKKPDDTFLDEDKKDLDEDKRDLSEVYVMSYRFHQNGCDTGKQEFKSNSRVDVLRQMCRALQNETLNRGCALESRQRLFDERCKGSSWN